MKRMHTTTAIVAAVMSIIIPAPAQRGRTLPSGVSFSDKRTKRQRTRERQQRSWRNEWR